MFLPPSSRLVQICCTMLLLPVVTHAQDAAQAAAQQAAKALLKAGQDGTLERAKSQAKGLLEKAGSAPLQTLEQVGGKAMLKGLGAAVGKGVSDRPQAANPSTASAPTPVGASPSALPPLGNAEKAGGTPVGVIEADQTDFDLNRSLFIYRGNVRARHPEFYIECEELEVEMIREDAQAPADGNAKVKGAAKGEPKTSSASKTAAAGKSGPSAPEPPPIRRAVARGPMVVIEKRSAEGDIQQGRCRRLEYDGKTGEITLRDYPQVQKGNVLHVATTADTVMIFDRAGSLRTQGRPRTMILNENSQTKP